jgi:hypothetical protein
VKHLNCKLYYQQLHLKYLCNLARYWLQAVWEWHDSVETCSSVMICEIIVHLLVMVQNLKSFKLCVELLFIYLYHYVAGGQSGVRNSVETRDFFPLRNVRTSFGAHPASYTMAFPGLKRPGRQVHHSSPSSSRLRTSGAIPHLPPIPPRCGYGQLYFFGRVRKIAKSDY